MRGEGGRRRNWRLEPDEDDENGEASEEASEEAAPEEEVAAQEDETAAEESPAPSRRGRRRRGGRRRGRRRRADEAEASSDEAKSDAAPGEESGAPDDEGAADDDSAAEARAASSSDEDDDEAENTEDPPAEAGASAEPSGDGEVDSAWDSEEPSADDNSAEEDSDEEAADAESEGTSAAEDEEAADAENGEAAAESDEAADAESDEAADAENGEAAEPASGEEEDSVGSRRRVSARAPASDEEQDEEESKGRGRGRRRRRRRRPKGEGEPNGSAAAAEPPASNGKDRKRGNARARGGEKDKKKGAKPATSRVSRSVPITEVVKEGDEVIVQISKEPIGTKGARVTSHVSLPGRYVVYMPTVEHIGISKRIGSAKERGRLRQVMEALKPPTGGLIVRTVAEGLTKKGLKADVGYLIKLWADVAAKREGAKAPTVLYGELDLVLKTARDLFTDDIEKIVIDDKDQYARLVRFIEMFLPERVKDIELYGGDEPIFDAYGIEDEIGRALSRKVPLPSGGYLIIDQAEALTAIDVNTGRYVGKGSKDLEETAYKTNLEAVDEIAYQLRFRNIGGLVILDLIDMEIAGNREKTWRALVQKLSKDKAKTTLNRISELGLIEMTRKRTRESLSRVMHEPCFYCDGTGQIQSRTTIAYEILRQIRRERHTLPGYVVLVNAHPAIVDLMQGEEKDAVTEAERRYMRRIELVPRREYHIEQFDLQGK